MYINKIKKIRKQSGISLEKLSELAGVSAGYLCHLEKGSRNNPSIDVMNSIATALNKTIEEVFFE